MTRPLPLLWLPLLLTLLSPLWAPTRAGLPRATSLGEPVRASPGYKPGRASEEGPLLELEGGTKLVVLPPSEVHGSPGKTMNLPCVLQPLESEKLWVMQIRWKRLEPWGDPSTVAEFDWVGGPRVLEPDRVQFVAAGKDLDLLDASLTLTELHPNDEANYTCEVTTFQHGSWRASTWLRVFYTPQVTISLCDDIGQQGHREISLSCDARCNPEPKSFEWSTSTGPLPPYAVPQGSWLRLLPSEECINNTFICLVSNALGTAQASMRVLLPGSSREQSSSLLALTIILLFVGLVALVLIVGALVYIHHFRKFLEYLLSGTFPTSLLGLSIQSHQPQSLEAVLARPLSPCPEWEGGTPFPGVLDPKPLVSPDCRGFLTHDLSASASRLTQHLQ